MEIYFLIGGLLVGGLLGYLFGKLGFNSKLNKAKNDSLQQSTVLQTRYDELKNENPLDILRNINGKHSNKKI